MGIINIDKFSKLQYMTFKNVLGLQDDAIVLFRNGSYSTSLFLSTIAQEELGKVFLIDDLIFHSSEVSKEEIKEYYVNNRTFYNHKYKQRKALELQSPFFEKIYKKLSKQIESGNLDKTKQNSIYTNLENNIYTGRIKSPVSISKKQALNQITTVNNLLTEIAKLKIVQAGLFDGLYIDRLINNKLLKKLNSTSKALS